MNMFEVFEWIRSHITFSDGISMDKKYYDGLIERGLALEVSEGMYKTE